MRGIVAGPSDDGNKEKLEVQFEEPAGLWSLFANEINRIKLSPEDIVCPAPSFFSLESNHWNLCWNYPPVF